MHIDSHCHLDHNRLKHLGDIAHVIERARQSGVDGILNVCCRIVDEFPQILATAEAFENVWCTLGTHPHDASDPKERAVTPEQIAALAMSHAKVVALGEAGLDYHYDHADREDQHAVFRNHLRACRITGLPIVVHSRESDSDIIRILREEGEGQITGVMHCFSASRKMAEEALAEGFYISFSGILTFPDSGTLRGIARDVPLDRVLVETDSPYLAPMPHRGKINQPAMVVHTARCLAEVYDISEADLARQTRENFFRLFPRAA